jgi:hypothetical protein
MHYQYHRPGRYPSDIDGDEPPRDEQAAMERADELRDRAKDDKAEQAFFKARHEARIARAKQINQELWDVL